MALNPLSSDFTARPYPEPGKPLATTSPSSSSYHLRTLMFARSPLPEHPPFLMFARSPLPERPTFLVLREISPGVERVVRRRIAATMSD
jgi:hypothetical protein